jgi:steroid 5-alpha reductase family enzyme
MKKSVPFAVIVLIALGIAVINIHPPIVLFGLFVIYGLSGYVVYGWRKRQGPADQRHQHLHRRARRTRPAQVMARLHLCYIR